VSSLAAVPLLSDYLSRFSGEFAGRMAKMGLTNHGLAKMSTRASRPICPCRQVPANGTLRLNMSIQAIELFTQFDANKVRLDAILRAVQKNVRKRDPIHPLYLRGIAPFLNTLNYGRGGSLSKLGKPSGM
jgi:hypothetical protein